MDVYSCKGFRDATAIGLKLLTKNEIQLSTMSIRIYFEFNPFNEKINFHKSQNHSKASFLPCHPLPHLSKTCLKLQEISRRIIIMVQRIFNGLTVWPLEQGHLESNHNCFWKQKFLKFSTNGSITFMNFRTVSWEVR